MTEKQFLMIYIIAFLIGLFLIYVIDTRMENKNKKSRSKQVNHIRFNPRKIVANYDEFIKENTKNMFLFEKKEFIKNVNSELYSIILKGVR